MTKLLLLIYSISLLALDTSQQTVKNYVFQKGKQFNLEYTLTAIAWEESQYGKYKINLKDPSCGIFQIMPKYLINRTELEDTHWNHSRLCERLIIDNDFSISAAILELKYWENYWKSKGVDRVWSRMVASYNGGFNANLDSEYLSKIKHKINLLKKDKSLK